MLNEQNTEITEEAEVTEAAEETAAADAAEATAEAVKAKKEKRRRKKKIKKILLSIELVLLAAVFVYAIILLRSMTSVDARFLRDMSRGLTASWMLESGELELQNRDAPHSTEFVGTEYKFVSKYRKSSFEDNKLGELAKAYINALKQCKSVAESNDPDKDFDGFWKEFSQPYGERLTAVYKIYNGEYGLVLDEETAGEEKDNLLAQGWILSKVGDIEFTRHQNENGVIVYNAELKNDSGFDLEFLDLEVELYDKDGNLIETASAYEENINNNAPVKLAFYQTSEEDVTQYRIKSEICRVKSAAN